MKPAIEINNLTITLGKNFHAVRDLSVTLPSSRIIGFIGPSGAGKTTLIRGIVGRQKLTSGTVTVFNLPAGSNQLRSTVSYMPQETSVYGDITIAENLTYFATILGIPQREVTTEVERLLIAVDLKAQKDQLIQKLSGGQKQRASLAVALIGNPKLLILDEPTVGLDPVLREELWGIFRTLANQGTTLIISSHVMDEAERCDDLLLIRDGTLLAHGSPEQLRRQTGTDSVEKSFLKLVGKAQ